MIPPCLLQISENTQCKLEKKFTNNIWVSDGIAAIGGAVNAQHESVWITTIMLHSSIHPTTSLCVLTWGIYPIFENCLWSVMKIEESVNRVSMNFGLLSWLESNLLTVMQNQCIGNLHVRNIKKHRNRPIVKMSANGSSMILWLVRNLIGKQFARSYP